VNHLLSQEQKGFWDYQRAIEKSISLEDGEKKMISISLPTGTTELIYRVSFLSPNGEIRNSLSTILSSAPSGYAQGASAAINLLNLIGGDNKGKFHIFLTYDDASNYLKTSKIVNSCYSSQSEIPGEKNFLTIEDQFGCLEESTTNLYFTFYNQNLFDDEKVVFELIPWVDIKSSKGWTFDIKEEFQEGCEDQLSNSTMPAEICACILDKFEEKFKVQELINLTDAALNKLFDDYAKSCLSETGENENQINILRLNAENAAKNSEFSLAIQNYLKVVESGSANSIDYNNLGYYYILTKQFSKAIKYLKEGEKLDEYELLIKGNIAHAYLLLGETEKAKEIYLKYKNQNVTEDMSWIEMVNEDFKIFISKNILTESFNEILNLLK
jgi:tetratricopeptide (TPR) repeat protein